MLSKQASSDYVAQELALSDLGTAEDGGCAVCG